MSHTEQEAGPGCPQSMYASGDAAKRRPHWSPLYPSGSDGAAPVTSPLRQDVAGSGAGADAAARAGRHVADGVAAARRAARSVLHVVGRAIQVGRPRGGGRRLLEVHAPLLLGRLDLLQVGDAALGAGGL